MADDDYGTDIPLNIPEAESQLDASENAPKDPTTTEVPPTAGSDAADPAAADTQNDAEYTKQLQNQYQTDIKRAEAHAHDQQQFIDHFQQQMSNDPKPPQQIQQLPPAPEEQKGQVTQRVLQVAAIAAVAFSLFGKRRNPYAQGALMGGIGSLIQGYLQGNAEKHKEDTVKWHQLNEAIHTENRERLQDYKDILANKHLNLAQQMDLLKMKGEFYKSSRMENNAAKGDLAAIQKHVEHMEKGQAMHASNSPMSKADGENWRALVLEKSGGKADTKTQDGLKWAFENYPPSQYFNEKKTARKIDPRTGKAAGGFSGKEKPDTESDDPLNLGIHKHKGPDAGGGTGDQSPSVLGGGDTGGW